MPVRGHARDAVHLAQAAPDAGDTGTCGRREGHGDKVSAALSAPLYPRRVPEVSEHQGELDGLPVFWREAPARDGLGAVPLYLHGVPTNSDDWVDMLALGGGIAPDLPGFGRSGKPGSLTYTIDEYDRFIERFLDDRGIERVRMLVHDWGGVGLAFAQRRPERVERLAIVNCVPFLPGYRWHRTARIWRTPGLGELAMGATNRFTMRLISRESNVAKGPMPAAFIDSVID